MWGYLPYLGFIVIVMGITWWMRCRGREIDSVIEREYQDPPIFDAGSYLGGDR